MRLNNYYPERLLGLARQQDVCFILTLMLKFQTARNRLPNDSKYHCYATKFVTRFCTPIALLRFVCTHAVFR